MELEPSPLWWEAIVLRPRPCARDNRRVRTEWVDAGDLDREAIAAARRAPPAERLRAGLALFDRTARVMAAGIRHERPGLDDAQVLRILRERLRLARRLEGL